MRDRFCNYYKIVFDEHGEIKNCGREAVIQLIMAADSIEPDIKHGNTVNGFMNVHLIKQLYAKCA